MKIILKAVKVIDSQSSFNQKVVDILIQNDQIVQINKSITAAGAKVIDCKSWSVSPGWVDLNVNFCDPGFETKEDINSGLNAAAKGGFVAVALMPNTNPAIKSKSEIEYLKNKSSQHIVNLLPVGSITANRDGKDISEMFDMKSAGAVAFSDGNRPIQDAGLMSRAILYAKGIDSILFSNADDKNLSQNAKINESEMSTLLGMKGIPSLAEELNVSRDIFLAEYQNANLHFSCISTAKSVELIKAAKKKGLKITADVSVNNIYFDDTALMEFDSNYKIKPPLRTKEDVKALRSGLKDGTIDAIVSQHTPEEIEFKQVEFETAGYGMIGLQTAFSLSCMALEKQMTIEDIVSKFSLLPRKILKMEPIKVEVGEIASLTLFNEKEEWELKANDIASKSKNTPLIGTKLKGKVKGIVNNAQVIIY